jgi:hypothetical protein
MHPQLILMVAQQQITDLRRAADHDRLVQAATTASSSDAAARPSPPRQSRSCAGSEAASLKRTRPHGMAGQVKG